MFDLESCCVILICNVWLVLLWNHSAKNPNDIQWFCECFTWSMPSAVCDVCMWCTALLWFSLAFVSDARWSFRSPRIQLRCIGERPRSFAMFHNMDTQTPHADGPYVACWFDRIYRMHHYIIVYLLLHHIILYLYTHVKQQATYSNKNQQRGHMF